MAPYDFSLPSQQKEGQVKKSGKESLEKKRFCFVFLFCFSWGGARGGGGEDIERLRLRSQSHKRDLLVNISSVCQ